MVDENLHLPQMFRWKNIDLPNDCTWESLVTKSGDELKEHYNHVLMTLSKKIGMIGEIYRGAQK